MYQQSLGELLLALAGIEMHLFQNLLNFMQHSLFITENCINIDRKFWNTFAGDVGYVHNLYSPNVLFVCIRRMSFVCRVELLC